MAYTAITSDMTDAKSPLNTTLMDRIRTNFDDHETRLQGAGSPQAVGNIAFTVAMAASACTVTLKQSDASTSLSATDTGSVSFRSSTITSSAYIQRTVTSDLTVVAPSGATLGTTNGLKHRIYVYAIDNAGTVEIALSQKLLDENILHSTTAIGAGSDSVNVLYSTSARTNVAIRVLGHFDSTQATAGAWVTAAAETYTGPKPEDEKLMSSATVGPGDVAISSSSGDYNSNATSYTAVTNLSVTLTTTGRPVYLAIINDGNTNSGDEASFGGASTSGTDATIFFQFMRDSTSLGEAWFDLKNTGGSGTPRLVLPWGPYHVDVPSAGTYTYTVEFKTGGSNDYFYCTFMKLIAYEL